MVWNPSPRVFARALSRGLGRCIVHLQTCSDQALYRDALHDAFVHRGGYDPQVEGTRTQYLLDVAKTAGHEMKAVVLQALPHCCEKWDADQLVGLTLAFAQDGNNEAERVLVTSFEQASPATEVFNSLAWGMVHLYGLSGYLSAARRRGETMRSDPSFWDIYPTYVAEKLFGEEVVARALAEASLADSNIAAFRDQIEAQRKHSTMPRTPPIGPTFNELLRAFEDDARQGKRSISYPLWSRHAPASEQQKVADALFLETDPTWQEHWLRVFHRSPFPGPV